MGKVYREPKLPWRQLIILSICRFAEPVALTSVFPYLPEMIESFNVPQDQVAKWAGITSASFSLSQCVTGIIWGRASDRFGRKPVIMLGMMCTMAASLLFGFSRSLLMAIFARSIAGASSGTVGILRTTVAELVPQKILQPRAFSVMPLVWTLGSIAGPTLSTLAKPATKYPDLFGKVSLFKEFPFLLPNLVASVLFLVGLSTGILFLKETLETKKHKRDYGRILGKLLTRPFRKRSPRKKWGEGTEQAASLLKHSPKSPMSPRSTNIVSQAPPSFREVFSPQSNLNLMAYTLLALHSIAYDQLLPVFLHLPPQPDRSTNPDVHLPFKFAGGFDLESGRIGLLFTMYASFGVFIQFVIFPPVARRYGVLACLKVCALTFPVAYLLTPFTVLCPTPTTQQISVFCVMMLKCCASIFAFPCTTILMTNSARSLRLLGTLNGVATSISALGRAIGPFVSGILFTWGINVGYVIVPWWALAAFAICGTIPVWWLIEMDGFGSANDSDSEDDATVGDETAGQESSDVTRTPYRGQRGGLNGIVEGNEDVDESEDEFAIAEDPLLSRHVRLSKTVSSSSPVRPTTAHVERRMSSPIGMREGVGPGGGRRLSNGLGQSMNAFGAGGAPCT